MPLSRLQKETGYYREQVEFRLSQPNYWGFVMKSRYGYIMNTAGLDLLALHSFVEKGLISGMGSSVGMGKESDVFNVVNDSGLNSVIKFYRIGRTSFRFDQEESDIRKRGHTAPVVVDQHRCRAEGSRGNDQSSGCRSASTSFHSARSTRGPDVESGRNDALQVQRVRCR